MANIYNSQLDAYTIYHKTQEESSHHTTGPALPALGHALAGSTGTAISNLAIYPLDLIITRLQVQRQLRNTSSLSSDDEYTGILDAFSKIYEQGGISAFYQGVLQDTGKSITDSFLFFLCYNYLRTSRLRKYGAKATTLPVLDELVVGALAGAFSKFFTTPISNIVTRKQTASMLSARSETPIKEPSVSDIASSIRSEKGLQGFWSGYSASLVLTLNPSLTFFLHEFFKRSLLPRSQRDDPGAKITFLMAAISKSIASTITYPFSLAKARAQTSSLPPISPSTTQDLKTGIPTASSPSDIHKISQDAKRVIQRTTVFTTILRIYREEGVEALYQGIWGEIFKGFFSHGITMIVKEGVHKFIIRLYFVLLKTLGKAPSASELVGKAEKAVGDGAEKGREVVKEGVERVGNVTETGKEVVGNVVDASYEKAGTITKSSKALNNTISTTTEFLKTGTSNLTETSKQTLNNTTELLKTGINNLTETAKTITNYATGNIAEATKTADKIASQEAGHLLGNANEQLSGMVEVGKGTKVIKREGNY